MEVTGRVIQILPEFKTQSGKVRHSFVVQTDGEYQQKIPFDVWGDERWNKMSDVKVGVKVSVAFDIRGNEWNGKFYASLNAWKVTAVDGGTTGTRQEQQPQPAPKQEEQTPEPTTDVDSQGDLPF